MCGLVASFGQQDNLSKTIIKQLIQVDVLRGKHSTGVFGVNTQGVSSYKKALSGTEFLELSKAKSVIDNSTTCLVGHNRYATAGAVNDVNAHPFTHGNITLVHNGTLTDQTLLPDSMDFEVDSENICHAVNKIGDKATFERTEGAFACIWYDEHHQSFNIVRNDERPLYVAFLKDNKQMYVASEREMLHWIMVRNKIVFSGDYKDYITEVPTCVIQSYKIKQGKVELVRTCPFVEAEPSWAQYYHGTGGYYSRANQTPTRTLSRCTPFKYGQVVSAKIVPGTWTEYARSQQGRGSAKARLTVYPFNTVTVFGITEPQTLDFKVQLNSISTTGSNQYVDWEKDPGALELVAYAGWPAITDLFPVDSDNIDSTDSTDETVVLCDNCGEAITQDTVTKTEVRVVEGLCICQNCWDNDSTLQLGLDDVQDARIVLDISDIEQEKLV